MPFTIEFHFGLRAGTGQVDIGPEVLPVEPVEGRGVLMGNVSVTDMFADHRAVLGLQQPVVVAVPGPGLGLFDQQLGHRMIDKLATIIRGKARRWKENCSSLSSSTGSSHAAPICGASPSPAIVSPHRRY